MAGDSSVGSGFPGRAGSRHQPRACRDISHKLLRDALAFRGGTALYKLHLKPAARYSEDIDLVQTKAEAAGPTMEALRAVLDPWLGKPQWKQTEGRVTFVYRFQSEARPPIPLKLKVEINTREHFAVYGFKQVPFRVASRWFEGSCEIHSYELDELLGTKLRALYQRKQGRDIFDLATALANPAVNPDRVVAAFSEYMRRDGHRVTRAQFEKNIAGKLHDPEFAADIGPFLAAGFIWEIKAAGPMVSSRLIERLPGAPWKGEGTTNT
jgi:predicted nucleotidyltransferase component of viral defense system